MNIDLMKTLRQIEQRLTPSDTITAQDLYKAYDTVIRLRSQLLGVIHDQETFAADCSAPALAELFSDGSIINGSAILTIDEPLPPIKELTASVEEHWLNLIHTAIDKAAQEQKLPHFQKAFVWIEVVTPKYTNNAKLWDTSNRAVNLIINNLKGVFFKDDDHEHMAFGVAGRWGEKGITVIRILPFDRLDQALDSLFPSSP